MTHDKQLVHVELDQVVEKRRLDQALNAKEFAVLAGISYSAARAWFRQPGFPTLCGVVFWQEFVQWRNVRTGLQKASVGSSHDTEYQQPVVAKTSPFFTGRAAQILAEAG
jgi:hypothetical protein